MYVDGLEVVEEVFDFLFGLVYVEYDMDDGFVFFYYGFGVNDDD